MIKPHTNDNADLLRHCLLQCGPLAPLSIVAMCLNVLNVLG